MDALSCLPPPATLSQHAAYYAPPPPHSDSPTAGRRHHKQQQLAPAGGRAGKRRSRASKRAPTTYISNDPANFRIMVQHITGAQADIDTPVLMAGTATKQLPVPEAALHHQQQPCFPTLDSWNVRAAC